MDAFYVDLTLESVAAVMDAQKHVASSWTSGFNSRARAAGAGRGGARRRKFVSAASVVKKLQSKKTGLKPDGTGVKQTIAKTSKPVKKTAKPPLPKIAEAGKLTMANIPENFTRSEKGNKMIKQRMQDLLDRDRVAFPSRPAFDVDTHVCRVKYPGCCA